MTNLNTDRPALITSELLFEEKDFYVPSLEEIQQVFQDALRNNFQEVSVEIVDCPDLKEAPFHLTSSGIGGSPALLEIGGNPYLLPLVNRDKIYDIKEIVRKMAANPNKPILAIGAGAGPFMFKKQNCEGVYNIRFEADGTITNKSVLGIVEGKDEICNAYRYRNEETRIPLLANVFVSEGEPGKVLRVYVKQRIGEKNFIEALRLALSEKYGTEKTVGVGGTFLFKEGKAKMHVMRDFSKTPITTELEVNSWLKFYNMPAPLVAVGTFVTNEFGLDLRLQHFHAFSQINWAGHYHYDVTPDTVEYLGYFNVADRVVRVDKPTVTHKVGRD